jgi:hypothetical protein
MYNPNDGIRFSVSGLSIDEMIIGVKVGIYQECRHSYDSFRTPIVHGEHAPVKFASPVIFERGESTNSKRVVLVSIAACA